MEELIDRIENKIAELIQTNEELREKVRLLSSERDQWVQECALHESERQNLNERLEKILSSLQEAGKELALSQNHMSHDHEIEMDLEEEIENESMMALESEDHDENHGHHRE